MPLPRPIKIILRQRRSTTTRYSVRLLIRDLQSTGAYFIHFRGEKEGVQVEYNPDDRPLKPSPNDRTIGLILRDGTHIIFPFDPYESIQTTSD
jgi:hypothetical protein